MADTSPPNGGFSRLSGLGRALSNRNYRLFFAGQGTSLIGTWMSRLATSWLVYRWSGDNAAWMLGVVSFIGLAPIFVLSPIAGVFVDRWDRYRVLLVTQILSLLQSAGLAAVAFCADPSWGVWAVCGLSFLQGLINSFDMPARQSLLVSLIAKREDLPNAIALNSSLVNGSRLIGPMIAGFVIALTNEAWCFVFDAISYVAVVLALLAMQVPRAANKPVAASIATHLREGVQYAWGFPPIRILLLLLGVVSFASMTQSVLMPVFAAELLKGGPYTLGLLSAASGLGALGGALYLASRPSVLGLGRVIIVATTLLGVSLAAFSWSHIPWLSACCLVGVGAGMMIEMAACNTLIQTMVDEDKRGRVMGFYSMAFQGTAPFGSLLTGLLSQWIGVREVVFGSAVVILIAAITFASQLRRLRQSARPIYERLGILPATAQGLNTAAETMPGPQ
ncbi:MFS transporter [Anatilimnocola floriformis]|uniref:MFS transporter n=1 Tax=Anatilimnocola floriformis TaxID=2948575 RepID=UPI0020C456F2|nr:MFS transporter [Anatilimnocola floriformis]